MPELENLCHLEIRILNSNIPDIQLSQERESYLYGSTVMK